MMDKYKSYGKLPGKKVGDNIYFHKSLMSILPKELYSKLLELDRKFYKYKWGIGYNIIKIDMRNDVVSFIMSEEFDRIDEPCIDLVYVLKENSYPKEIDYTDRNKDIIPIYHHKWMFVSDFYKGFDVIESKERSDWWEKHPVVLKRKSEDKYFKSRIGLYGYWKEVLKEIEVR